MQAETDKWQNTAHFLSSGTDKFCSISEMKHLPKWWEWYKRLKRRDWNRRKKYSLKSLRAGSNVIDGKAGTIMACCQGNCCGFVLLRFFLYFVLSFQGQKMRGKKKFELRIVWGILCLSLINFVLLLNPIFSLGQLLGILIQKFHLIALSPSSDSLRRFCLHY